MHIPFPLALSVGTDIISCRRMLGQQHASGNHLHRLAARFLHPQEFRDLDRRFPFWSHLEQSSPTVSQASQISHYLAGRWAAKEAAKKAWGATLVSFKDLRVVTLADGGVEILCQSYGSEDLEDRGAGPEQAAKLSISHDGDYAVATVIATPLHPDIVTALRARKMDADRKVMSVKNDSET